MARLDRVTSTYMMALSDGPVEPGHDVNGKSQRLSALVLYVPLRALTRGMINALALDQMQPHAVLINCSRGPVIDFAALHDALTSGRIAGCRPGRASERTAIAIGAGAVARQCHADLASRGIQQGDTGKANAQRVR
jgi:hypothetical protein